MLGRFLKLLKAVKKIKPRISIFKGLFIIFCCGLVDLLQIGLDAAWGAGAFLNPFVDVGMAIILYIWFRLNGVKISVEAPQRFIPMLVTEVIKIFTVGIVPCWIIDGAIDVITSWAEDVFVQAEEAAVDAVPGLKTVARPVNNLALKAAVSDEAIQQGNHVQGRASSPNQSVGGVAKDLITARKGSTDWNETAGKLYNPEKPKVGGEIGGASTQQPAKTGGLDPYDRNKDYTGGSIRKNKYVRNQENYQGQQAQATQRQRDREEQREQQRSGPGVWTQKQRDAEDAEDAEYVRTGSNKQI